MKKTAKSESAQIGRMVDLPLTRKAQIESTKAGEKIASDVLKQLDKLISGRLPRLPDSAN
jgi:hypothetical protein